MKRSSRQFGEKFSRIGACIRRNFTPCLLGLCCPQARLLPQEHSSKIHEPLLSVVPITQQVHG